MRNAKQLTLHGLERYIVRLSTFRAIRQIGIGIPKWLKLSVKIYERLAKSEAYR